MYGQGNYAPEFRQGSHTPMPPFQQHPVAPPPPPPPLQLGLSASQPSTIQQAPPSISRHGGYSSPVVYQLAPSPPVQQGPPFHVANSGMLNSSRPSYLSPPPPPPLPQQIRGSIPVSHQYPTAQQTSQWTQNMHHIPTPVPSPLGPSPAGPSHPEMFPPTIPSRVLPPLPSQGPTSYRVPNHLQQPGSVQGTQQIPRLPPPPPTSSFFTPAAFGSFVHSAHQNSNESNMGPTPPPLPPPPPFSPPPLPPSPPPPTSPRPAIGALSSTLHVADSDLLHHSESGRTSNLAGSEVMASDSVDNVVVATQIREDALTYDDYKNPEGRTSYDEGSHLDEDLSNVEGTKLDLYPPPLKPAEEKVVQKIEVLCNFIAKNGPSFEDMARQKESGNPEFKFLFGGEPGSEAAVAHEYFEWMKNKCILACKLPHGQSNSALRPSDIDTLTQTNSLMHTGASHSSSDSDMDMEDDITQPDAEQQVCSSFEGLNSEAVMIPKEFQERSHTPQNAVEHSLDKDAIYGSSGLAEQEKEYSSQSKASATAAGSSENFPGELIKGASPFRLLQDYASDDSSDDDVKPWVDEVNPVIASPSATAGNTSLDADIGSNLQSDPRLKSLSNSDTAFSESVVACYLSVPPNAPDIFPESQRTSMEANVTSIAADKVEELVGNNDENQESIDNVVYPEDLQPIDALDGIHDTAPESGKSLCHKEDVKYKTILPKFDEFGRLVREGASDSDSDGSRYTGRRGKRERSWSRSRSPDDRRRRRRRSPPRRKEKRNRSRSWSPKKRRSRSRSRSPSYWHGGESSGDKVRRDKGQLPQCFDFLRGRCHRGAFCRYMHHDSDNSDGARRYRSKHQYVEVPPVSRTSDLDEEVEKAPPRRSVRDQDMPGSSFDALTDGSMDREKLLVSVHEAVPTMLSGQEDKSVVIDVAKSEKSREVTEIVHETRDVKEEILEPTTELHVKGNCMEIVETAQPVDGSPSCLLTDAGAAKSLGDTSHGIASSPENLVIPQSQANPSLPALQNSYHQTLDVDGSSTSGSSLVQTSTTFQNQLPVSAPHLNMISPIQSYPDRYSQLPPPLPSLSQGTSAPPPPQPHGEVRQPTSSFSSLYIPTERCPPNQALPQNQHTYFTVPPNSSWSLPPPPPLPPRPPFVDSSTVISATAMQGTPWLQFQENPLPPRSDSSSQMFVRQYLPQLPHSQVGEFEHHSYSLMKEQEPSRPLSQMGDFRPNPLPMGNPMSQPFGGTGPVGERFSSFPVHGLNPSIAQGNVYHQPVPSSSDSAARIIQSFPGDNLASDEFSTSFQNFPQLRALYGLQVQRSQAEGLTGNLGDYRDIHSTMPRYADLMERKQLSNLSDFGGSRISRHYNPYASTFVQPLTSKISKFSSDEFKQEKDRPCINLFDASYSLSHAPVDGHGVGSLGSRHTTSSPKAARAADLPRPDNDQYDPLFDSIEPSSNSSKKFGHGQRCETTLRLSSSRKPLDVEENSKQKEVEAVTETSINSENDECGETADAEVGDVDNVSASNPLDEGDTAVGEIEIDQIKTTGKSKKSNDSRSMKLFKVAIANFVKEELKPSWRQGNMSKEAFKTIVKKTVEKVSGAMKNHHVPKSQAKINRYIDSSQRKLTKLVKGYVHKYAEG